MSNRKLAAAHIFVAICFIALFLMRLADGETDGFWNVSKLVFYFVGAVAFAAIAVMSWKRQDA